MFKEPGNGSLDIVERSVNLTSSKQPSEAVFGRVRLGIRRVLTLCALLFLVGTPVIHAAAHHADSDHGSEADPTECLVCRVVSSSPPIDFDTQIGVVVVAPAYATISADTPNGLALQIESSRTELARGPPLDLIALTGRLTA